MPEKAAKPPQGGDRLIQRLIESLSPLAGLEFPFLEPINPRARALGYALSPPLRGLRRL
jgi:hypothetical protein